MQNNLPRPSAGKLRVAIAALRRTGSPEVAEWLTSHAVEADFEETKLRLAGELGYADPEDPYIVKAARELAETDVPDERI